MEVPLMVLVAVLLPIQSEVMELPGFIVAFVLFTWHAVLHNMKSSPEKKEGGRRMADKLELCMVSEHGHGYNMYDSRAEINDIGIWRWSDWVKNWRRA